MTIPLIFEWSRDGATGYSLPDSQVPTVNLPEELLRENLALPEVSELEVIRHFVRLSQLNFAIDTTFYPLGSCTMKYNPKVNEEVAAHRGIRRVHPYTPIEKVQGALQVMYELQQALAEIAGMDAVSLQPAAGAHGELTGMLVIRAYLDSIGQTHKTKVIVPDSAHGTNPATAAMAGYQVVTVRSDDRGNVDLEELKRLVDEEVAAMMLTNPNTLGLFDEHIREICEVIHEAGGLMYGDGANMNAIMGIVKPGELGFDVLHFNLHKTFTTPHGGGGPGAGPIAVKDFLAPFLPSPIVTARDTEEGRIYQFQDPPKSIGKVRSLWGNFAVLVRAYTYIMQQGSEGLRSVSEHAILNANYLLSLLRDAYQVPYDRPCMHEFVLSGSKQKRFGVRTLDIAKRLIDYGFHPPTIYFPLIVEECLMIEPTETENKRTLDEFAAAMIKIAEEAEKDPELVKSAPHNAVVRRLDETTAARKPDLVYQQAVE
ncbi:Glycine dehydrogenase (decarboxylating) [Thermobaculum terrenum ATCC BAA-798]|uniref:Probable glycine dehydrogenase (decarboxylating) subunit 2 n=1 Tax=Thermobaculum terrenum (strain ATCC BAA-798 / CCMEE 7001 / YNP1) TaxID=525904 RepID=D1CBU9_THET1|nr:aminomethyl-transferring glycine dehydrogenase subunit GcvPB [Thermobaculum terrenum]ACZ42264.1 Glycine dehydrogenase (decarboxylating) [Thermobaculum terrenum ATCC BAA-798]